MSSTTASKPTTAKKQTSAKTAEKITTAEKPKEETTAKKPAADKTKKETVPKTINVKSKSKEPQSEASAAEKEAKTPKQRRVVNKEQIDISFEELIKELNDITDVSRESTKNSKLISKIKKVTKDAKTLQSDTARVVKLKPKSNRSGNAQCGFLKQKQISKELAQFTGWSPTDLKSSVDVTKFLCNYIKTNKLSDNCENKRFFTPDSKMHILFETNPDYDSKHVNNQKLTYPLIQRLIQVHFPKSEAAQ